MDPSTARQEQISAFHQFDNYSSCANIWSEVNRNKRSKVVNLCLMSSTAKYIRKFKHFGGKRTISFHIHVENNSVLFPNMYCAVCNGLPLHQMKSVADYNFECDLNFIRIAWQVHKKFLCTTHEYGLWHFCYVFHMNEPPGPSYITTGNVLPTPMPTVITVTSDLLTLENATCVFVLILKGTRIN